MPLQQLATARNNKITKSHNKITQQNHVLAAAVTAVRGTRRSMSALPPKAAEKHGAAKVRDGPRTDITARSNALPKGCYFDFAAEVLEMKKSSTESNSFSKVKPSFLVISLALLTATVLLITPSSPIRQPLYSVAV
jgi:hypothetical protein